MNRSYKQTTISDDEKNLLAAAAVVGVGLAAVALFPNPITTPVVIGKCSYALGKIMGGRNWLG
jgi:uncharacterized protein (DUF2062 family)